MTSKHVCEIVKEQMIKWGYPKTIVVKYWGHDPDDIELGGLEEDCLTGFYDVFMVPEDKDNFWKFHEEVVDRFQELNILPFHLSLLPHSVEATKNYYPEIYKEAMKNEIQP